MTVDIDAARLRSALSRGKQPPQNGCVFGFVTSSAAGLSPPEARSSKKPAF
jgi:hypothetical protein